MRQTVAITDYGINNLKSVYRMVQGAGAHPVITNNIENLSNADKIILPGIGHFGRAVQNLNQYGLLETLSELVTVKKKPVLGICLGMQLMMEYSEEAPGHRGLGWLSGEVVRLHATDARRYKVPHIGWNSIRHAREGLLLKGIADDTSFYFTHSYSCQLRDENAVAATTDYDGRFVSVIEQENIFGVQFHPEKSHNAGISILTNFLAF